MLPELLASLSTSGLSFVPPFYALKVAGSDDDDRKVNFLIFQANDPEPCCVAKTIRATDGSPRLQREYTRQCALYDQVGHGIPQPLAMLEVLGQLVFLEEAVHGQSLSSLLKQARRRTQRTITTELTTVLGWLADFQKATALGETVHRADVTLPLVAGHGDFWAGNIFVGGDKLQVIDWEDYAEAVEPTRDAFFFMTTYALSVVRDRWGRKLNKSTAFHTAFLQDTWLAQTLNTALHTYAAQLNIPHEALPQLFEQFLQDMATADDHSQARKGIQARWQNYLAVYRAHPRPTIWQHHD